MGLVQNPMRARQIFRPPDDRSATPAQINKLLVMLSKQKLIWSEYNRDAHEWEYAENEAVDWVRAELGFKIDVLSQLSHGQVGACYEELGE
jgi:hypothetical protein